MSEPEIVVEIHPEGESARGFEKYQEAVLMFLHEMGPMTADELHLACYLADMDHPLATLDVTCLAI